MQALEVRNLVKQYRNGVQALKGIDLNVAQGDFFALLGPNGAGKSTLIGICTSLVNKTSGSLRVFGHDLDTELEAAKACIGVVPQELNLNQFETCETIVVNQAGFYGIPRRLAHERAEKYLNQLSLWDKRHKMARTLSAETWEAWTRAAPSDEVAIREGRALKAAVLSSSSMAPAGMGNASRGSIGAGLVMGCSGIAESTGAEGRPHPLVPARAGDSATHRPSALRPPRFGRSWRRLDGA